jgi:ADP-ribosylglycohydrolase
MEELESPDLPEYYRNMGWVRIAFRNAFWWLRAGRPFAEALSATVQQGGDADTNGAIAGALLGAVAGEPGIPLQWRQAVLSCEAPRPAEFCAPDLLELADQLAEG